MIAPNRTDQGAERSRDESLTAIIFRNEIRYPDSLAFRRRISTEWRAVTCRQFGQDVRAVANGLIDHGIRQGERVALLGPSSYEWTVCDYAILAVGAISVPLYETAEFDDTAMVIDDCVPAAVFVHESAGTLLTGRFVSIRHIWPLTADTIGTMSPSSPRTDEQLTARRSRIGRDTVATLAYTPGTTGLPKGCMLTHGNILASATGLRQLLERFDPSAARSTMSILPPAHSVTRVLVQLCLQGRVTVAHCPDPGEIGRMLPALRPTFLVSVPRMFEVAIGIAERRAIRTGAATLFAEAISIAEAHSRSMESGRVGVFLRMRHGMMDRLFYAGVRAAFGGRLRLAICCGDFLDADLAHIFRGMGITLLAGYGLTEATGPVTLDAPQTQRIGTQGRSVPGVDVDVDSAGQILVRGPVVFGGYWNDPAATETVLDGQGRLRTGDHGHLEDGGNLILDGRIDDSFLVEPGVRIYPEALQAAMSRHPLIAYSMVDADDESHLHAYLGLDARALERWMKDHHRSEDALSDLATDPAVQAEVLAAVRTADNLLPAQSRIDAFTIIADIDDGLGILSPTEHVRRRRVLACYGPIEGEDL